MAFGGFFLIKTMHLENTMKKVMRKRRIAAMSIACTFLSHWSVFPNDNFSKQLLGFKDLFIKPTLISSKPKHRRYFNAFHCFVVTLWQRKSNRSEWKTAEDIHSYTVTSSKFSGSHITNYTSQNQNSLRSSACLSAK